MTLCAVVRSPPVSHTVGRRGRVTLLLKNPDQPVREANLRGITISSHVSKLEPTAFYAVATAIYERHGGGVATGHTPTPPYSRTTFRAGGGGWVWWGGGKGAAKKGGGGGLHTLTNMA